MSEVSRSLPGVPASGADLEIERELEDLQPALHAYVGSLIGAASGVPDVVQEANILIWDKRETYRQGSNFKAWAFRIAYYKALSYRRDEARRGKHFFGEGLLFQLAAEGQAMFEATADARRDALAACVTQLPADQRELLERHYVDRVSLTDIAHSSGRRPSALHKAVSRIRFALRRCIYFRMRAPKT